MAKVRKHLRSLVGIQFFLVLASYAMAQDSYRLEIVPVDKPLSFFTNTLRLTQDFPDRDACTRYVIGLPALMQEKGYITASLDSISYDSTFARVVIYAGSIYYWNKLDTRRVDPALLDAIGWKASGFEGKPLDIQLNQGLQQRMLSYLENNGHPFGRIYFDSMQVNGDSLSGQLVVDKGPAYKIDSIRLYGGAKISNFFLQRFLEIPNGSFFDRSKLERISARLLELNYVEEIKPYDLSLLGTGSVLNLHLKPKKSSQINFLVGFLPNSDQFSSKRLLVTGEANIRLNNALGNGEIFGLNWQQLQVKSPRLNILFRQPFIFKSNLGLDLAFDMFRKDSSFLNVNMQFGGRYALTANRTVSLFFQRFQTILSQGGINTATILQTRRLPDIADVSSSNLGLDYEWNQTDYRNNPRKGWVVQLTGTAGTKKIRKNNEIVELKDPSDPAYDFERLYDTVKLSSYQFRVKANASRYFRLKGQSVIRTSLNGGWFQSGSIFRNELFQIGGFKLLRGFDEESQYLSEYLVATLEYRYLIGLNSFFYVFTDGGWGGSRGENRQKHRYFSTGMGLAFETKAGVFNLAWAVGKRDDTRINLQQSKVHVGFVSYF